MKGALYVVPGAHLRLAVVVCDAVLIRCQSKGQIRSLVSCRDAVGVVHSHVEDVLRFTLHRCLLLVFEGTRDSMMGDSVLLVTEVTCGIVNPSTGEEDKM